MLDAVLYWIGAAVAIGGTVFTFLILRGVVRDIYWSGRGACRLRCVLERRAGPSGITNWSIVKFALTGWAGGNYARYAQVGGLRVPFDGRRRITRAWIGA